ncbi:tetratricopeptide repeat protein [Solitalea koreensis]|uniref:Tetratricopeptide repeat-containing protein n=1 Tax=Solitalea koreensis TaxID=543615 RepID=A0A521D1U8_9SPHI|nr:tetratricopeptide repeat protein [Solitalea koreensis]SMO65648.1 Tetratricopeptide repeat-containing protein [Solitalea koreensis]
MIKKQTTLTLALLLLTLTTYAQQTAYYTVNSTYRKAIELFFSQKYASANELFRQVYTENNATRNNTHDESSISLAKIDARYYAAVCALELNNNNAESELLSFINNYPENPNAKAANFQIGRVYYKKENYSEALNWFSKVDDIDLNETDRTEYNFKVGYCNFVQKDYAKAQNNFTKVKNTTNKFSEDATYYFGHIAYLNKDYKTALDNLNKVKNSTKYAEVYQYYSAQIFLIQGRYDDVILFTEPIIRQGKSKYIPQLNKIAGAAYFNKADYVTAAKYFDTYLQNTKATSSQTTQDTYQIGFTFYKIKEYDKATAQLERLIDADDVYGQYGMLTLGQCFLIKKNKINARAAFQRGSNMTYDDAVREEALLAYAKLAYETNFAQQGLGATREFVTKYPRSKNIDEAKTLLGEILLSSKNYKDALEILETVKKRKENSDLLYQKVAYYRGVEVFNAHDYAYAVQLFEKSLNYPVDGKIEMLSIFWKAESMFELKNYDEAISLYNEFFSYPNIVGLPIYKSANYSMAYAYFEKGDYSKAAEYFERYSASANTEMKMLNDALLRLGDSYFVLKAYDKALTNYNKIIIAGAAGADYATFQKAMIQGVQNKLNEKVYSLKTLQELYPNSSYIDDAQYEMAYAHFTLNNTELAKQEFNELIKRFPNSSYVPKSLLNIALVYYNTEDDNNALTAYKNVVAKYPDSPEAKEAVLAIKNIYVGKGNASEFIAYTKNTPGASLSASVQDSISFEAANNLYLKGKCDQSIPAFESYLKEFPAGYFINEAHFYHAECLLKQKRSDDALPDYQYLVYRSNGMFTERSLVNASKILMSQNKYEEAIPYLKRLEDNADYKANYGFAVAGLMRANSSVANADSTLYYAKKVIAFEKMPQDEVNTAYLFSGKSYLALRDTSNAMKSLGNVSTNTKSVAAAEAKYLTGVIQFNKGQYKTSQKTCFEVIDNLSNHDYWVAKSFILLADNYIKLGDVFQAKSTLQSIIDNYSDNDDVLPTAKSKLAEINALTKQN